MAINTDTVNVTQAKYPIHTPTKAKPVEGKLKPVTIVFSKNTAANYP